MMLVGLATHAQAANALPSDIYSALLKDDGHTWCVYKNLADYQADANKQKLLETASLTYSSNRLAELSYKIEAESGDWIVIDKYTPFENGADLRRINLLAQANLNVIQETVIHGAKSDAFKLISVSTQDEMDAELRPDVVLPEVPVKTNVLEFPFAQLVVEMRTQPIEKLCKRVD